MIDVLAMSAAIDGAIEVLDLHGHVAIAVQLRVHGPELLRLARLGQKAHDAREADRVREPETPAPRIGPATERCQIHG